MPVVVDASALVAVLFGEPEGSPVQARLPETGLAATALIGFEVANAAVQKLRRGSVTPEAQGLDFLRAVRDAFPASDAGPLI